MMERETPHILFMQNSFGKNVIPPQEEERLRAVARYKLLDNVPSGYFTNLAQIVAKSFDAPIALVSLVEKEEVIFPGNFGMEDTTKVARGTSLCSLAILDENVTVFEDAVKEPCLLTNPLITGEFGLRFYAGAPITTSDGYAIGTVCIVDKEPRPFSEEEKAMLKNFAQIAMNELETRKVLIQE